MATYQTRIRSSSKARCSHWRTDHHPIALRPHSELQRQSAPGRFPGESGRKAGQGRHGRRE
jgi:hypothetical protein